MNTPEETSKETKTVELTPEIGTNLLFASFAAPKSRRNLIKAAAAGTAGLALGAGLLAKSSGTVHAQSISGGGTCTIDDVVTILSVAATAERLAVTFYTNGIKHANRLGLHGASLAAIRAAQVEEQIHELFFVANGGKALTSTFSFPQGDETFEDLSTFIATQQALEGVFDSAFLAAIHEFAAMHTATTDVLARIAGQIATVEAEHRALGRFIGGLVPADNWAFSPVLIPSVGAAPAIVAKAGFLSPKPGNSYEYHQVAINDDDNDNFGVTFLTPTAVGC